MTFKIETDFSGRIQLCTIELTDNMEKGDRVYIRYRNKIIAAFILDQDEFSSSEELTLIHLGTFDKCISE